METSQWFHLTTGQFGYPQPESDFGYLTQTYNMTKACPICKIGLKQVNEFRFRAEPKAQHSHFIGFNWVFDQIFVRQPVQEIFKKEGITGISFSTPVINKTGVPMATIKQLHVDNILKKGLITGDLNTETCEYPKQKSQIRFLTAMGSPLVKGPFCGQIKYNYPQGRPFKFENGAFINMPDFVRLAEWFGSGASASQPIFVSEKIYDIIKGQKWRGAFLAPVEFF